MHDGPSRTGSVERAIVSKHAAHPSRMLLFWALPARAGAENHITHIDPTPTGVCPAPRHTACARALPISNSPAGPHGTKVRAHVGQLSPSPLRRRRPLSSPPHTLTHAHVPARARHIRSPSRRPPRLHPLHPTPVRSQLRSRTRRERGQPRGQSPRAITPALAHACVYHVGGGYARPIRVRTHPWLRA